jgi:glycosyltransferase involved in cell wall biosynthesis
MNNKKKILFLGETFRADAITWMEGLKEFGDFEIITWELKKSGKGYIARLLRLVEFFCCIFEIKKMIKEHKPDMVIAERSTSYGFLSSICGIRPIAIAQQGITDLWPLDSITYILKKWIQDYAYKKADLIHAWGEVMAVSMREHNVDMSRVMILPKGINLSRFENENTASELKIEAIVTRSLFPEYSHATILNAFSILNEKNIDFKLTIVGDGNQNRILQELSKKLKISDKVTFTGRIPNTDLPALLQKSNIYISMPTTEGVSSSLFEAMASSCYPIVTDIAGNQAWIKHRQNGQLIEVNNAQLLADEIVWAYENLDYRKKVVTQNRVFVQKNANYAINMKLISEKYHELINAKTNS